MKLHIINQNHAEITRNSAHDIILKKTFGLRRRIYGKKFGQKSKEIWELKKGISISSCAWKHMHQVEPLNLNVSAGREAWMGTRNYWYVLYTVMQCTNEMHVLNADHVQYIV